MYLHYTVSLYKVIFKQFPPGQKILFNGNFSFDGKSFVPRFRYTVSILESRGEIYPSTGPADDCGAKAGDIGTPWMNKIKFLDLRDQFGTVLLKAKKVM